jgi:hypothetical protein
VRIFEQEGNVLPCKKPKRSARAEPAPFKEARVRETGDVHCNLSLAATPLAHTASFVSDLGSADEDAFWSSPFHESATDSSVDSRDLSVDELAALQSVMTLHLITSYIQENEAWTHDVKWELITKTSILPSSSVRRQSCLNMLESLVVSKAVSEEAAVEQVVAFDSNEAAFQAKAVSDTTSGACDELCVLHELFSEELCSGMLYLAISESDLDMIELH